MTTRQTVGQQPDVARRPPRVRPIIMQHDLVTVGQVHNVLACTVWLSLPEVRPGDRLSMAATNKWVLKETGLFVSKQVVVHWILSIFANLT